MKTHTHGDLVGAVKTALDEVSAWEISGCFRHSGYCWCLGEPL